MNISHNKKHLAPKKPPETTGDTIHRGSMHHINIHIKPEKSPPSIPTWRSGGINDIQAQAIPPYHRDYLYTTTPHCPYPPPKDHQYRFVSFTPVKITCITQHAG